MLKRWKSKWIKRLLTVVLVAALIFADGALLSFADSEQVTETHKHIWGETGETVKEATCTEEGEITYTCIVEGCGEKNTEAISVLAHKDENTDGICDVCGGAMPGESSNELNTFNEGEQSTKTDTSNEGEQSTGPDISNEDNQTTEPNTSNEDNQTTGPNTSNEGEQTTEPSEALTAFTEAVSKFQELMDDKAPAEEARPAYEDALKFYEAVSEEERELPEVADAKKALDEYAPMFAELTEAVKTFLEAIEKLYAFATDETIDDEYTEKMLAAYEDALALYEKLSEEEKLIIEVVQAKYGLDAFAETMPLGDVSSLDTLRTALSSSGSGDVKLTDNITVTGAPLVVNRSVTINLNGKKITGSSVDNVITIDAGATLTIKGAEDSSSNKISTITGGTEAVIVNNGTLTINRGYNSEYIVEITGSKVGVINNSGAIFNFILSKITGNTIGVNNKGNFTMLYPAYICSNSGTGVVNSGTFTIEKGDSSAEFSGSIKDNGGWGVENSGTFTINDFTKYARGTISIEGNALGGVWNKNAATFQKQSPQKYTSDYIFYIRNNGGPGIKNESGTFNLYGGVIGGNVGGIVNGSGATFNLYGGSIINNHGRVNGGGVYNEGTFKYETDGSADPVLITGNSALNAGGGVYSGGANSQLTIPKSAVYNNTSGVQGRDIAINSGQVKFSGGSDINTLNIKCTSDRFGNVIDGYYDDSAANRKNLGSGAKVSLPIASLPSTPTSMYLAAWYKNGEPNIEIIAEPDELDFNKNDDGTDRVVNVGDAVPAAKLLTIKNKSWNDVVRIILPKVEGYSIIPDTEYKYDSFGNPLTGSGALNTVNRYVDGLCYLTPKGEVKLWVRPLSTSKAYNFDKTITLYSGVPVKDDENNAIKAASPIDVPVKFTVIAGREITVADFDTLKKAVEGAAGYEDVKTIKLGGNVTMTSGLTVPANRQITLELNGKTLTGPSAAAFTIVASGALTIKGAEGTLEAKGTGDGRAVTNAGLFTLESGTIKGGENAINNTGTFVMSGGKITGCNSANGAVYNTGTFTMTGGSITGNGDGTKNVGGVKNGGTFYLTGGEITGNKGLTGGVYNTNRFNMTGGRIANNTGMGTSRSNCGGGVCMTGGTFNMAGGVISGNTAKSQANNDDGAFGGGGVSVSGGTFNLSGGSIQYNTAQKPSNGESGGGGVFVAVANFNMTGGSIINNKAENTGYGGGIYYYTRSESSGGSLSISGGLITGNYASGNGAAIYLHHDHDTTASKNKNFPHLVFSGNPAIYGNTGGAEIGTEDGNTIYAKITGLKYVDDGRGSTTTTPKVWVVKNGNTLVCVLPDGDYTYDVTNSNAKIVAIPANDSSLQGNQVPVYNPDTGQIDKTTYTPPTSYKITYYRHSPDVKGTDGKINDSITTSRPSGDSSYAKDQIVDLPDNMFGTRDGTTGKYKLSGYIFDGWTKDEAGAKRHYYLGDKFEIKQAEEILYAQWLKEPTLTVTVPSFVDDSSRKPIAAREQAITVKNTGVVSVTITGMKLSGTNADIFEIIEPGRPRTGDENKVNANNGENTSWQIGLKEGKSLVKGTTYDLNVTVDYTFQSDDASPTAATYTNRKFFDDINGIRSFTPLEDGTADEPNKPVLTINTTTRNNKTEATVGFNIDKEATEVRYIVKEKTDTTEPTEEQMKAGTLLSNENNSLGNHTFNINGLNSDGEKIVYMIMKDTAGNWSEIAKREIPPCVDFGKQPVGSNVREEITLPGPIDSSKGNVDFTVTGGDSGAYEVTKNSDGTLTVAFKPTDKKTYNDAKLEITGEDKDGNSITVIVPLSGEGVKDPVLAPKAANRENENKGDVKFTSDTAGTYYYKLVKRGESAPPNISGYTRGGSCEAGGDGKQISFDDLKNLVGDSRYAGEYDVWIMVVTADHRESKPLKIEIPPYVNFGSQTVRTTSAAETVKVPTPALPAGATNVKYTVSIAGTNGTPNDVFNVTNTGMETWTPSQNLSVTFTPNQVGDRTATMTVTARYEVQENGQSVTKTVTMTVPLTGKGVDIPTLAPKAENRTDLKTGDVTFTSSKGGLEYHYVVIKKGDNPPTDEAIKNSNTKGTCNATAGGDTKITLNDLKDSTGKESSGEYEVYIKVKDGNNWSDTLKMEIPPYVDFGNQTVGTEKDKTIKKPDTLALSKGITATVQNGADKAAFDVKVNEDGTITVTFKPMTENTTYTGAVEVKGKDANGKDVTVLVPVTGKGIKGPELKPVSSERTKEKEGGVSFKSDTPGTYYYVVVPKGTTAPDAKGIIENGEKGAGGGKGTASTADVANPIKLDEKTLKDAGAYDVYIVLKTGEGVESKPLKMEVPPYVDFGKQTVNTNGTRVITIPGPLEPSKGITPERKGNDKDVYTVTVGTDGTITVKFTPTAEKPYSDATIELKGKDAKGNDVTVKVSLTGTGVAIPTLTPISSNRTNVKNGDVTFTSSKGGEYYYIVVKKGEKAPTKEEILASSNHANCTDGTSNNISRDNLTAPGEYEVYIVVKTSENKTSDILKMEIPPYVDFGKQTVDKEVEKEIPLPGKPVSGTAPTVTDVTGSNNYTAKIEDGKLIVTFKPTTEGEKKATVQVTVEDGDGNRVVVTVPVSGTGVSGPILRPVSSERESVPNGGVSFTSTAAGTYYYVVKELTGAAETDAAKLIDNARNANRTATCNDGKNELKFTDLTGGSAKKVYIVMTTGTNGSGDKSNIIEMIIPPYVNFGGKLVGSTNEEKVPLPENFKPAAGKDPVVTGGNGNYKAKIEDGKIVITFKPGTTGGSDAKVTVEVVDKDGNTVTIIVPVTGIGTTGSGGGNGGGSGEGSGNGGGSGEGSGNGGGSGGGGGGSTDPKPEEPAVVIPPLPPIIPSVIPPVGPVPPITPITPGRPGQTPETPKPTPVEPTPTQRPERPAPEARQPETPQSVPEIPKLEPVVTEPAQEIIMITPEGIPVVRNAEPIPDSPYGYPTYKKMMPDPNDPASPEIIVVIDDDDVPLAYRKVTDPDDGSKKVYVPDSSIPLASVMKNNMLMRTHWALVNLILTILSVLAGIFALMKYMKKRKEDEDEEESRSAASKENKEDKDEEEEKRKRWYILSVLAAIVSVVAFILTEDMSLPMVFIDRWTILMLILALLTLPGIMANRKRKDEEEEREQRI